MNRYGVPEAGAHHGNAEIHCIAFLLIWNVAGSTKAMFARLLSKFCRLPTYCKSLLREAVCAATAAAPRVCRILALLWSPPGSAYWYVSTEPVLVHEKQFQRVYTVQGVGLRAVPPGLFTWCSSAVKRLEMAREAVFCLLRCL